MCARDPVRPRKMSVTHEHGDPEARGVLDTIAEDEQASLNFLSDACQRLNAGA